MLEGVIVRARLGTGLILDLTEFGRVLDSRGIAPDVGG